MLLFEIPDIRLFWSKDERFLGQFRGLSENLDGLKRFTPFSKYPVCYKDIAFWLPASSSAAGRNTAAEFHENDVMEIVRGIAGDSVEDVQLIDQFTNQKTGRKSMCYRINYRRLERTMRNEEANELQAMIEKEMVEKLGIEIR
jgi:phenylalanyl-tRNA synthetase alpha chain